MLQKSSVRTKGAVRVRRHQPHSRPRSSAIRSYRLKLCPSMPWRPHARLMQQRPEQRLFFR
ncbi:MAG: hypothetical protein VB140_04250 [Burkholderia sp.]